MRYISILGSTGSIGTQTLDVLRTQTGQETEELSVVALAAGGNISLLEKQIREFHPKLVCVFDAKKAKELSEHLADMECCPEILTGMDGLIACATVPEANVVVTAVVGMIGIRPTIAAIRAGKDIALANKETLVTAGHLIMPLAKECGVRILPVDSEHSAIFQCLQGEQENKIQKILLTASGGPFRGRTKAELEKVTLNDALKHPNWSMGHKITIDSATMVNKGLEVMEAHWLFDVALSDIQVVVQPQSVIHSMVEFEDGGVIAQLGTPDMRLPIAYALYYPHRISLPGRRLDFWTLSEISFEKPNMDVFEGLSLAFQAAQIGGSMPVVFNAANERAVALFLNQKIGFTDITSIIKSAMERHVVCENPDLDTILSIEQDVYDWIDSIGGSFTK